MMPIVIRNLSIGAGIPGIIVPVMEETEEAFIESAANASLTPADALEIRLDRFERLTDHEALIRLLRSVRLSAGNLPLLMTVRTAGEGGGADLSERGYETVLETVLKSGEADLIDIELKRASDRLMKSAAEAGVPVLLSRHDFVETPANDIIEDWLRQMASKHPAVAKIAVMANSDQDADRLMALSNRMSYDLSLPLIAVGMGKCGEVTRIAGERSGSVLTFAANGCGSAPGQIDVHKMRRLLNGVHRIRQASKLLYLTGFMGTGKSSTAVELGRLTGQIICDTDALIETEAGCSIPEIFGKEGEEGFRKRETACLLALSKEKGGIVSCGGGIVLNPGNRSLMRRSGDVILLRARPETIVSRLAGDADNRPLLKAADRTARIRGLMKERQTAYEDAAHLMIDTDGLSPAEAAREIILMVENEYEVR